MLSLHRQTVGSNVLLTVCVMFMLLGLGATDDQFLCCMRGIRSIRSIRICPAPCCESYEEKIVYPAKLGRISYCVKIPNYKAQEKPTPKYIPKPRKP